MLCVLLPASRDDLVEALRDARARTLALARDVDEEVVLGPRLPIVNSALWEFGHVGWFQERWMLRRAGEPSLRPQADHWYDSSAVPHGSRWELDLPSWEETLGDLGRLLELGLERLARSPLDGESAYCTALAVFHEDMHQEAFAWTRQVLARSAPAPLQETSGAAPALQGDALVRAGRVLLGSQHGDARSGAFVFDNEQGLHAVEVAPFALARRPVTELEFAAFVDDGGYEQPRYWSEAGRAWLAAQEVRAPLYWERSRGCWQRRLFERTRPLAADRPMVHVSAHEADAWCRWARRRLPSEAEWEAAARGNGSAPRTYPWGEEPPGPRHAHLDLARADTTSVDDCSAGDTPEGVRQLLGNVWEWTSSVFEPYPGFEPGPYSDYSRPWFGTHRVLRGGSWATRARLIHAAYRNFFTPERRDVFAGFRTCAL